LPPSTTASRKRLTLPHMLRSTPSGSPVVGCEEPLWKATASISTRNCVRCASSARSRPNYQRCTTATQMTEAPRSIFPLPRSCGALWTIECGCTAASWLRKPGITARTCYAGILPDPQLAGAVTCLHSSDSRELTVLLLGIWVNKGTTRRGAGIKAQPYDRHLRSETTHTLSYGFVPWWPRAILRCASIAKGSTVSVKYWRRDRVSLKPHGGHNDHHRCLPRTCLEQQRVMRARSCSTGASWPV
jgi:hypothetical protein